MYCIWIFRNKLDLNQETSFYYIIFTGTSTASSANAGATTTSGLAPTSGTSATNLVVSDALPKIFQSVSHFRPFNICDGGQSHSLMIIFARGTLLAGKLSTIYHPKPLCWTFKSDLSGTTMCDQIQLHLRLQLSMNLCRAYPSGAPSWCLNPWPGTPYGRGRLSTVGLLIFVKKVNNISNEKKSWSKLVSTRRSTVLRLFL